MAGLLPENHQGGVSRAGSAQGGAGKGGAGMGEAGMGGTLIVREGRMGHICTFNDQQPDFSNRMIDETVKSNACKGRRRKMMI